MNSTQTLKLAAVSRNYFNMPIWVANHCDLFKEENLQVDIELHEPIDEVTARLEKGKVQLALGVTEHVILNHEAGGTLKIIGGNVNKLHVIFNGRRLLAVSIRTHILQRRLYGSRV